MLPLLMSLDHHVRLLSDISERVNVDTAYKTISHWFLLLEHGAGCHLGDLTSYNYIFVHLLSHSYFLSGSEVDDLYSCTSMDNLYFTGSQC